MGVYEDRFRGESAGEWHQRKERAEREDRIENVLIKKEGAGGSQP
jgi:hypothetical protein